MKIKMWGVRGSIPTPGPGTVEFGGNTPCLQISLESTTNTVIFDSGSGVRELGVRLIQRSSRRFAVTDIGQEYYRHCLAVVIEARAAQEVIDRSRAAPHCSDDRRAAAPRWTRSWLLSRSREGRCSHRTRGILKHSLSMHTTSEWRRCDSDARATASA